MAAYEADKAHNIPIEDPEETETASVEACAEAAAESDDSAAAEAADPQAAPRPEAELIDEEEAVMSEAAAVITAVEELDKVRAELNDANEKYLRLHAEWDTYRRRMNEQRAEDKKQAAKSLVENIIPVIDDFERTISYATQNGEAGMLEGTQAVYNKLLDALRKGGVEILDPQGEAFDALEAQAVQMLDDPSVPDETVAQVLQKGFKMGVKVLRPATVVVTTGGPIREAKNDGEDEA